MRRMLVLVAVLAALAVTGVAAAAAPPKPNVNCGSTCDGSGGYTGCKSVQASHGSSVWLIYSIRHVLVVNYCKRNGVITSISVAAHYCDISGFVTCSATAAWLTGGGVGSTWATFEAHATWTVTPLHIYNNTDVVTLLVPTIDG
jgi:hypothetical protein